MIFSFFCRRSDGLLPAAGQFNAITAAPGGLRPAGERLRDSQSIAHEPQPAGFQFPLSVDADAVSGRRRVERPATVQVAESAERRILEKSGNWGPDREDAAAEESGSWSTGGVVIRFQFW